MQDGYTFDSVECVKGDDTQDGANGAVSVTVHNGETWTCTFTNKPNVASIKVIKKVDGTVTDGWTIDGSVPGGGTGRFTGGTTTDQGVTTGDENAPLTFGLTTVADAGTPVDLSEVTQGGYTVGDVSCVADGQDNQDGTNGAVTVTVHKDETWTCTFNNSLNTATVKVLKKVDGTQVADWTINATNPSSPMGVTPGSQVTTDSGTVDFALDHVANGGSTLDLAEVQQAGFTAGQVSCAANGQDDQTGPAGSLTLDVSKGQTWTCTFNNTTNTGTIKVIKKVDGTQVADWTVNATAPADPATIDPSFVVTAADATADFTLEHVVDAGSTTTLTEVDQPGFTSGDVSCVADGQDNQDGTAGSVDVTVLPGQTWTCTFNNSLNTATVDVLKKVDGTQTAGWQIDATNPSSPLQVSPGSVTTASDSTKQFALDHVANGGSSLDLAEVKQDGYTAGDVSCVADGQDNQDGTAGAITLDVSKGEAWTCTFNNSVNNGTIKVIKKVDGTQVADWTVDASAPACAGQHHPGFGGDRGRRDGGLRPRPRLEQRVDDHADRGRPGRVHVG